MATVTDGLYYVESGAGEYYLVLHGQKCRVPGNPDVAGRIFHYTWATRNPDVPSLPDGVQLSDDAVLIRNPQGAVALYTNGQQPGIASEAVAKQYAFDLGTAINLPAGIFDSVPNGPLIDGS